MADVRALLKAKREEIRISHPFATYTQTGQLRCTACSIIMKHASAWNGHLISKAHRNNVARIKVEETLKDSTEDEKTLGKRKTIDNHNHLLDGPSKKLKDDDDNGERPVEPMLNNSVFPSDFFSDPSHAVAIGEPDSDEEEENDKDKLSQQPVSTLQAQSDLDLEWEHFKEVVINTSSEDNSRETYERATIFAEPQLSTDLPEGFPQPVVTDAVSKTESGSVTAPKDEASARRKQEEDEKELIMDRLLDEERAQEEADERVNVLKTRLELLKQKRTAARASKSKK